MVLSISAALIHWLMPCGTNYSIDHLCRFYWGRRANVQIIAILGLVWKLHLVISVFSPDSNLQKENKFMNNEKNKEWKVKEKKNTSQRILKRMDYFRKEASLKYLSSDQLKREMVNAILIVPNKCIVKRKINKSQENITEFVA